MKKKFISFGGPTYRFHNNINRICNQANQFNYFDEIVGITEQELVNDQEFWQKNGQFVINNHRGFGYWIWKPHLINRELEKMEDGDILIYADSGCELNINGRKRLLEYVEMLNNDENEYGILSFILPFKENHYTKKRVFDYFNCDDKIKNDWQCMATTVLIKKTKHSSKIIKLWSDITKNHILVNDEISNEEIPEFIENRHDQSIYSLLVKMYGSIKIDDETYYPEDWSIGKNNPILAKRL